MAGGLRIDKCVCCQRSFSALRQVADETESASVDELRQHIEFGTGCGLCNPYVKRMLRTGETVFHEIISDRADAG